MRSLKLVYDAWQMEGDEESDELKEVRSAVLAAAAAAVGMGEGPTLHQSVRLGPAQHVPDWVAPEHLR
jgi:hypothetical protein